MKHLEAPPESPSPVKTTVPVLPGADGLLKKPLSDRITLAKRIWLTVVALLVTFLLAEGIARLLVVLALPAESLAKSYDAKYYLAQRPMPENRPIVLIVGDSVAALDIYPELLASELRRKGYNPGVRNLASPGNTAERSIFQLRTAIKAGNRPDLVIYNVIPRLFNQAYLDSDDRPENAGGLFRKSYIGGCLYPDLDWRGKISCFFKKNSYLYRYRSFLKQELVNLPKTLGKPKARQKLDFEDHPTVEVSLGGWTPIYRVLNDGEFKKEFDRAEYNDKYLLDFDHFRWTDHTLAATSAFCRKEKLPLLVVSLPEHSLMERYYRHYDMSSDPFARNVADLSARLNIGFLDLRHAVRESDRFYDPEHLNAQGAVDLSRILADRLTRDAVFRKAVKRAPLGYNEPVMEAGESRNLDRIRPGF